MEEGLYFEFVVKFPLCRRLLQDVSDLPDVRKN